MGPLTQFIDGDSSSQLMQRSNASKINPLLQNPALQSVILKSQTLVNGANKINHTLQRKLQGWYFVRQRSAGTAFDTQDTNDHPELTLNLTVAAASPVVVDILVF